MRVKQVQDAVDHTMKALSGLPESAISSEAFLVLFGEFINCSPEPAPSSRSIIEEIAEQSIMYTENMSDDEMRKYFEKVLHAMLHTGTRAEKLRWARRLKNALGD